MLGTYTYNEIFRKTVGAFGTLFNNIEIRRKKTGTDYEYMKVPLAYGPKQKFLARLQQTGNLTGKQATQITLPRISFEITNFAYDSTRKVSPTQTIRYSPPEPSICKMESTIPDSLSEGSSMTPPPPSPKITHVSLS